MMSSYSTSSTTPSGSGGEISIRQFRTEDAEQVHALLVEGLVYAGKSSSIRAMTPNINASNLADSPRNAALRKYLYLLTSVLALTFLVLVLAIDPSAERAGLLGALIVLCGAAGCAYICHSITLWSISPRRTVCPSQDKRKAPAGSGSLWTKQRHTSSAA